MKKIIYILISLSVLVSSCGDFDEVNRDPDKPAVVLPEFLATNIILQITKPEDNKWFLSDTWLMKGTSFTEHMEWYLYNKFERSSFKEYYFLLDGQKMIELVEADEDALTEEEKNSYRALNYFVRSFVFYKSTMNMGDIPCSDALKGETEGIFGSKYDAQEEVFATILKELELAAELFGNGATFKGDIVYDGNTNLWLRAVNGLRLRVLNALSKKQTVSGINVQEEFEKVVRLHLFNNEEESFQRVYDPVKSEQWYPFYYENQNYWSHPVMTSFFVDMMKDLNDYRLFYYTEPADALKDIPANSFDAYSGVNPVLDYGTVQSEYAAGLHSSVNRRYHRVPEGEPVKFIAYSELQFIMAEAALRGWKTPLSAKEHYDLGVRAAMSFTAEHTAEEFRHDRTIDEAYIDSYLTGPAAFDPAKGLEQIMIQKYIGSFLQLPFNTYYDYRRTGYPKVPIDPETNMNEVKTQLPLRWMYPEIEYTRNRENVEEAIQRQFGGVDTPNEVMWLLK